MNFNILFVDDDIKYLMPVKDYLDGHEGIRIACAGSGEDALKMIRDRHFDMIFTDFNMPGMNGVELAKMVRIMAPEIPIILRTGSSISEIKASAMEAGVSKILSKPTSIERIVDVVKEERGRSAVANNRSPSNSHIETVAY